MKKKTVVSLVAIAAGIAAGVVDYMARSKSEDEDYAVVNKDDDEVAVASDNEEYLNYINKDDDESVF